MSDAVKNQQKLLDMIVASISVVCAHLEVVDPKHNTDISKHAYLGSWIKQILFSTEDQVVTSFLPLIVACGCQKNQRLSTRSQQATQCWK